MLRPPRAVVYRIGWIYRTWLREGSGLEGAVSGHLRILDTLAAGQVEQAVADTEELINFACGVSEVDGTGYRPARLGGNSGLLQAS